jgi:hypothetical protein
VYRAIRSYASERSREFPLGAVMTRLIVVALVLISAATGLSACGGAGDDTVVVRVGNQGFSRATIDRWTSVVRRGGAFSDFRGQPKGSDRQRAITLLITSNWLIHEARRQGVAIEDATVEEDLAERKAEGGVFQKRLRASGQTLAGVKLEIRAELAAEAVRERLAEEADNVTERELLDYYKRNRAEFSAPEVRVTDLVENLPSSEAAAAFVRRVGTARHFPSSEWHERVTQTSQFESTREKTAVVNAIFAARRGVISQPVRLNDSWAVFVVRRVLPPVPRPLVKVRAEVLAFLRATRQRQLKARFDHQYTTYWRSKTTCRPEYLAPGCPQFHGQLGPYEDPFSSRAHPLLSEQGASG